MTIKPADSCFFIFFFLYSSCIHVLRGRIVLEQKQINWTNKKIELIKKKSEFIRKSDIIFIMYHFDKFILPNIKTKQKKYVIDCWRCIKKVPKNYIKIDLGKNSNYIF